MIFGERTVDLRGVFSEATVLWSKLPTECLDKSRFNCGHIDVVLSKPLLKLFDIKTDKEAERRLNLFVYSRQDGPNRGMARIFANVDGSRAIYHIVSTGSGNGDARRVTVQRDFPDGTGDIIPVKDERKDGFLIEALSELAGLYERQMVGTDKPLLCGSCTAEINGLPRPKV